MDNFSLPLHPSFLGLIKSTFLTWNFKHINNAIIRRQVERICRSRGYEPVNICTPEELLEM